MFAVLALEYPDLVWDQPTVAIRDWGGRTLSIRPTGPLTTL